LQRTVISVTRKGEQQAQAQPGSTWQKRWIFRYHLSGSGVMKSIAVALVGFTSLALLFVEISAGETRGSRGFGHSKPSHSSGSKSGGVHSSFGGHGLHLKFSGRHVHPHPFGHHKHLLHKKLFVPHHDLVHHHVILRRPRFHHGFFLGQRAISVLPSSVVIWSHPGVVRDFTVLPPERIINEESLLERPLISIMLRHRHDLGLSPQQVQDLEQLRDGYQREAIRYEADLRIAEMALQRLLKVDPVKLEQVRAKLQDIERLKVELRFARIQAIEQGKALLSPEQYEKLQSLLGESRHSKFGDERFSPLPEEKP
jgi:hypothetical protein